MGMIAIVQMVWLPGYIATRAARYPNGLTKFLLGFSFSLWWNLVVVLGLSLLGLLGRPSVISVMVFEIAVLALVCILQSRRGTPQSAQTPEQRADQPPRSITTKRAGAFASLFLVVCAGIWIMSIGETFFRWDAVASWNRWATEWASDGMPKAIRDYPQLVPATWSISYILIGHDQLQQFARSIQGLFPMMILGGLFCAGVANRSPLLFRAVPITFFLIWTLYKPFFISGYMDIPVAALTTFSWCLVLQARSQRDPSLITRTVLAGAFVAGVSGVCKQAGLVMVVSYPALVLMLVPSDLGIKRIRLTLLSLAMILVVLATWYGYSGWLILSGKETFIGNHLVGSFHARPSMTGRLITAYERLVPPMSFNRSIEGSLVVWFFLITSLLGVLHKVSRPIVLAVAIPSWFIWALGFSYSTRNMAVAVPAMGVGMAGFFTFLLECAFSNRSGFFKDRIGFLISWNPTAVFSKPRLARFGPLLAVTAVLVIASLIGWLRLDPAELAQDQIEQRSKLGVPPINTMLFEADQGTQRLGQVATSYAILRFIPGFEDRAIFMRPTSFESFETRWADPKTKSFLVRDIGHVADDARIIEEFNRLIRTGALIQVGQYSGWTVAIKSFDPETEPPPPLVNSSSEP